MSGIKKLLSLVSAAAVTVTALAANVTALESYDPYSYDRWGDPVSSQAGYTAERYVDGEMMGCGTLYEPADMYISHDDLVYIADKGNNRIVITDLEFNYIREMKTFSYGGETLTLSKPMGVFVDKYTGYVYICDTENSRVIKCDTEGNVDRLFGKPENELYDQALTYNPGKVLVDKAGNVYVVVRSVTSGAVMFDANGEFLRFYGANRVEATAEVLANAFWNLIATDAQRERSTKKTPVGFSNFDIDDAGFIYTVTESQSTSTDLVKKLNPRGDNIIDATGAADMIFGDMPPTYYSELAKNSSLTDIDIGPSGELNILDFQHGRIFQYDKECWLLFIVGGTGDQLGLFTAATAIESYDDRLFVLDARKGSVTIFRRTPFGEIVTNAANLYNDGLYEESLEPWRNVLKYDGNYRRAYIGIGNALYSKYRYKEAMEYFEISISRGRYNKAFEGYRDLWLKANYKTCIAVIILLIILIAVYKQFRKRGRIVYPWEKKRKESV